MTDIAQVPSTIGAHDVEPSATEILGFGHRLRQTGLLGSMGKVASSVDNALIESFWSTMQRELPDRQNWHSRTDSPRRC